MILVTRSTTLTEFLSTMVSGLMMKNIEDYTCVLTTANGELTGLIWKKL